MWQTFYRGGLKFLDLGRTICMLVFLPGTVLHELSHALGCLLTGAEIIQVNYWQWPNYLDWTSEDNPAGRVRHYSTESPWREIVISLLPLPVCSGAGTMLLFGSIRLQPPISIPLLYLSLAMYSSSRLSNSDLQSISDAVEMETGILVTIISGVATVGSFQILPIALLYTAIGLYFDFPPVVWISGAVGYLISFGLFAIYDWVSRIGYFA